MATNAAIGYQMTFGIWNGVSYNNVAEVTKITPPQYQREAIEATHQGSPNGYKEYIAGLLDASTVTVEINYVPSASDPIIAAMQAGVGQFRITFPNNVTCTFSGVITEYSPETPIDDKMSATISIMPSGRPVWA